MVFQWLKTFVANSYMIGRCCRHFKLTMPNPIGIGSVFLDFRVVYSQNLVPLVHGTPWRLHHSVTIKISSNTHSKINEILN